MRRVGVMALLLGALVARAAPAWAEARVLPGPAGSQILLERDTSLPLLHLQVVLRRGAGADPAGQEGRSGMLAHVPSRSVGREGDRAWLRRLANVGGVARTRMDYQMVRFEVTALRGKIDGAAALLAERLRAPLLRRGLSEEAVRHEMEEDIEQSEELDLAGRCLRWALYEGHPLAHGVFGTRRSLEGLPLAEVLPAYARALRGPGVIFALDGDIDEREAAALIWRHFAWLPAGASGVDEAAALPAPPRGRQIYVIDRPRREEALVALGQRAPFWGSVGQAALEIAVAALGAMPASRLRRDPALPSEIGIYAALGRGLSTGVFAVRFRARSARVGEILGQVLAHYQRWAQEGITVEEFERARRYVAARRAFEREGAGARVERALVPLLLPLPTPLADPAALSMLVREDPMEVSRADIGRAMRAVLTPGDLQICAVGGEQALEEGLTRLRAVPGRHQVIDERHL